jgi:hypothetical protein
MAPEKTPRKIDLVFFRNNAGGEPVRDWLKGLDDAEGRAIGTPFAGTVALASRRRCAAR